MIMSFSFLQSGSFRLDTCLRNPGNNDHLLAQTPDFGSSSFTSSSHPVRCCKMKPPLLGEHHVETSHVFSAPLQLALYPPKNRKEEANKQRERLLTQHCHYMLVFRELTDCEYVPRSVRTYYGVGSLLVKHGRRGRLQRGTKAMQS